MHKETLHEKVEGGVRHSTRDEGVVEVWRNRDSGKTKSLWNYWIDDRIQVCCLSSPHPICLFLLWSALHLVWSPSSTHSKLLGVGSWHVDSLPEDDFLGVPVLSATLNSLVITCYDCTNL